MRPWIFTRSSRRPTRRPISNSVRRCFRPVESGKIFLNTASAALDFFEKGRPDIDRKETLVIRRVMDLAGQKRALKGFVRL